MELRRKVARMALGYDKEVVCDPDSWGQCDSVDNDKKCYYHTPTCVYHGGKPVATEPSLEEGYIHHGGTLCAHMGVHKLETCFIHQTYREKHFGEKPASEVVCQCGHPRNRHYLYDQDNEESRHRCAACEAGSQAHKFTESATGGECMCGSEAAHSKE